MMLERSGRMEGGPFHSPWSDELIFGSLAAEFYLAPISLQLVFKNLENFYFDVIFARASTSNHSGIWPWHEPYFVEWSYDDIQ